MRSARDANRGYFRNAYRTGEHGWAVHEPSPYAVRFLERLSRLAPGGALLDVGCGEGRHSFVAVRRGFRVTAVDYEPLALQRARRFAKREGTRGITFQIADVFRLPFPASSFDVVLDYGCLHHQKKSDWPRYERNLLRVLKPRGYYVLSVFSPRFRFFRESGRNWHIAYGAYRRCFTKQEIIRLFGVHFEVLTMVEERGKDGGFWHIVMRRRR